MFSLVRRDKKPNNMIEQQKPNSMVVQPSKMVLSGEEGDFEIQLKRSSSSGMIKSVKKNIVINKENHVVDAYVLIRMIRNITQQIGEYKNVDHTYAAYVIPSLRKARNDIASDLVKHFGIHWSLEDG